MTDGAGLRLGNTAVFLGTQGGTNYWSWTACIEVRRKEDLNEIEYVEYRLHPSFKNPIRRVRNPANGFALTTKGWGTFKLQAVVRFVDPNRRSEVLEHNLEFPPPPVIQR